MSNQKRDVLDSVLKFAKYASYTLDDGVYQLSFDFKHVDIPGFLYITPHIQHEIIKILLNHGEKNILVYVVLDQIKAWGVNLSNGGNICNCNSVDIHGMKIKNNELNIYAVKENISINNIQSEKAINISGNNLLKSVRISFAYSISELIITGNRAENIEINAVMSGSLVEISNNYISDFLSVSIVKTTYGLVFINNSAQRANLTKIDFTDKISKDIDFRKQYQSFSTLSNYYSNVHDYKNAIRFKVRESRALLNYYLSNEAIEDGETFISRLQNIFILLLNRVSNFHGGSVLVAFLFVIGSAFVFNTLILLSTDQITLSFTGYENLITGIKKSWSPYFDLFNLTNRSDYLSHHGFTFESQGKAKYFFSLLFVLSKIFISYGIYQFVVAFRKFRR